MKKYFIGLVCIVLLSGCKKEKLPEDGGNSNIAGIPTLITNPNTDLTRYSTKLSGSVFDTGYSKIIEAGFVIDTFPSPTVSKNIKKFIVNPDQNGLMEIVVRNFSKNTTYFFRSFGTNDQGTGYGNEEQFTTPSQKIFNGNVTLTTQQEVEAFGQAKYTTINGELKISGSVMDLSPLENLAIINYAFRLINTSQLTTIKGMDSLEAVSASYRFSGIQIQNNTSLKSLEGLEKLTWNNGYLLINNNDELTDLNGLNNLSLNHGGQLRIEGCDKLLNLHGLENFQWLDGDIFIKDNSVLEDISAFENLNVIFGAIRILNNVSLKSNDGFKSLHKADQIEVVGNTMLTDLNLFSSLDTVTFSIALKNNNSLMDLSGLENIKICEGLAIEGCPSLTSLKGIENLYIKDGISIKHTGLINLDGFPGMTELEALYISNNDNLQNLLGLNKLTTITGVYSLSIQFNNQLNSLAGLENLTKVDGKIFIAYNQNLNDFCALKPLLQIGLTGQLDIRGNEVNPTVTDIINNCP